MIWTSCVTPRLRRGLTTPGLRRGLPPSSLTPTLSGCSEREMFLGNGLLSCLLTPLLSRCAEREMFLDRNECLRKSHSESAMLECSYDVDVLRDGSVCCPCLSRYCSAHVFLPSPHTIFLLRNGPRLTPLFVTRTFDTWSGTSAFS